MASADFWDDQEQANAVIAEMNFVRQRLRRFAELGKLIDDARVALSFAEEEEGFLDEVKSSLPKIRKELEEAELEILMDGEYDQNNAVISLHPGAGGTESQDWAQMLMRMYLRWAERRGYKTEVVDLLPGEEAGIKSATIIISGPYAYGFLRPEKGVHRLVRISPFDASGRRHTSFASLDVEPEIKDGEMDIKITPDDLQIDTYRSGGAGGQHVNKTDSAVRITHLPTGIVVQCQNERSQHANKETAMRILRTRLFELERKKQEEHMAEIKGEQKEIAWGSQIRSYVFHPYSLVKDHRTNTEIGNIQAVMDGEIDPFIYAYLQWEKRQR